MTLYHSREDALLNPENDLDVTLTGVQRDGQIGHGDIVEIAPVQVVDIVAHRRQLAAKEALASPEVAQV